MKRVLAALAFACLAFPALAQQCEPIDQIKAAILAGGVPEEAVTVKMDVEFVNLYTRALGPGIPDGSVPAGIIIVEGPQLTIFGIIEKDNCVRYHMRIPTALHKLALHRVNVGA